ncbi:MAG: MMPL family transporter [Dokdonella sp.]|mgnify:FL=1|uniref:efflux RND transporter permease subunit n=1 Tax=Dokdonella sp. TaxID=2291710 RepID=UPI002C7CA15C|nr:MMPL family transporter [Xanthomonadales bacterium]MBK7210203.1 MMPL family transporter [Xanthomonadales bacterium]MBL0223652.1 MMPL family transporter [Xanthomonadales bacterium]HQV73309.1 MMPL family transporter [Dokdonella sp.]HQW77367.1 MMPL family transporter [Dokdonella sp.]
MSAASSSNKTPNAFHRTAEKLVFGNRPIVLILFAIITVIFTYFAAQLRVDAGFKKQIPLQHEYMQTFLDYEQEFGGANRVLIAVMDKNGDMFNLPFFQTMEKITQDAKGIDSVDEARVRSIFTPNVRFVEVVEDGFAGGNVIPQDFTPNVEGFEATPEQFATVKANMEKASIVGRLVAKDFSGAMIWVDLVPENPEKGVRVDYNKIAAQLDDIRGKYENEHTTVAIIGFAKMVGDITAGAQSVIWFFGLTIAFTWLLLFIYSSSVKLASLTVFCALVSVVWMLGALRLLGFGIDPMNMLTPFLIFAIAVSHGEQMINRYRGEIFFGGLEEGTPEELSKRAGLDPETAARDAFRALLVPGSVALIAGCIGFAAILMIPIRIIFELAITATIGVALTILTDLVLLPVLLSYTRLRNLPRKRAYRLRQLTQFDKIWTVLAKFSKPVPAAIILVLGVLIWFTAERFGEQVMIGDAQKGVAELRPEARYNKDAVLISDKFALGVDILNVIAEGPPSACTNSYPVMELVDRFAWHLRNVEGVAQVMTLPMAAKIVNAGWNEGNVRWRVLPRDADTLRLATQGFETDTGLLNADCSAMPIMAFLTDHRATTIDRVINSVKQFRQDNQAWAGGTVNLREKLAEQAAGGEVAEADLNQVNLRLATGNVGVMAAINDEVRAVKRQILYMLYAAVFLMCLISFRSPLAALCITLPLVLVTELGHALMVYLDIGMKINTLTVVALGVGIGVDYGIYIFARMREALLAGRPLTEAYFASLKTTGIAIFYTALTLAVGVGTWVFSDLKFQADMGVMLTFMFVVNMIAAIVFLPALCRWLLRPMEKTTQA